MKQLIKAWKEYKESLKYKVCVTTSTGVKAGFYYQDKPASFEGFMDYLVSKEKKYGESPKSLIVFMPSYLGQGLFIDMDYLKDLGVSKEKKGKRK